jgi:transcriptional regulator with XRE-family HTH domain
MEMDLSQETLAERADLHRTYIADIERGVRNVSLKNIGKLARALDWPPGSGTFILYGEPGKKRGMGNGVTPIKTACMSRLRDEFGWELETGINVGTVKLKGGVDATCPMAGRLLALEWETGNISSSHRASVRFTPLGFMAFRCPP